MRKFFGRRRSPSLLSQLKSDPDRKNVVLFGEAGVGKSSIVNMLSGEESAEISSGARGCTFESEKFDIDIGDESLAVWDTAGIGEGQAGKVPRSKAIVDLYKLLVRLSGGISLLVFVTRGPRVKEADQQNWVFFTDVICRKKVPAILVVTGMEGEAWRSEGLDGWWKENEKEYDAYNIVPDGRACVTATRGRLKKEGGYVNEDIYEDSKKRLLKLVQDKCAKEPFQVPPTQWFTHVAQRTYEMKSTMCLGMKVLAIETIREEVVTDVMEQLTQQCGMSSVEVRALAKKMRKVTGG